MVANWYVNLDGTEQGPMAPEELKRLAGSGRIAADTLIRREGMAHAVPATQVKGLLPAESSATRSVMTEPAPAPLEHDTAPGRTDDDDNAFAAPQHGPLAARAAPTTGARAPAGFWIRTGAYLIDVVVMLAILFVFSLLIQLALPQSETQRGAPTGVLLALLFMMALSPYLYLTLTEGIMAATVGKKVFGLMVVTERGRAIGFGSGFLRSLMRLLFVLIPLLSLVDVLMVVGEEKRALHDRITGTRVVYRHRRGPAPASRRTTTRMNGRAVTRRTRR